MRQSFYTFRINNGFEVMNESNDRIVCRVVDNKVYFKVDDKCDREYMTLLMKAVNTACKRMVAYQDVRVFCSVGISGPVLAVWRLGDLPTRYKERTFIHSL